MKLFISYSRDDKAWVYELWRALRDEAHHDAWIDRRIVPASDWWESILENIETCDAFLYVMTPKSVESIYCTAEMDYAVALNKPIVPLMLKATNPPDLLRQKRVQYETITDDLNMDKVLFRVERALGQIRDNAARYQPKRASRPAEPEPSSGVSEHIYETFASAEEALAERNISLAESLFQKVIKVDPQGLGMAAAQRLGEMRYESDRSAAYAQVVRMAANPATLTGARAAWNAYLARFGQGYDPERLGTRLNAGPPAPAAQPASMPVYPPPPAPPVQDPRPTPRTDPQPGYTRPAPAQSYPPDRPRRVRPQWIFWLLGLAGVGFIGIVLLVVLNSENGASTPAPTSPPDSSVPAANASMTFAVGDDPSAWTPQIRDFSGVPMAYVPAGCFRMGSDAREDEQPVHEVCVEAFWIDVYEVTNAQYGSASTGNCTQYSSDPNQPRNCVTWFEARDHCAARGGRLPTEAEWEYAARGPDALTYPWGNDFVADNAVFGENSWPTAEVGSRPGGISWVGALDMSGNVWEWTSSLYEAYPYQASDGRERDTGDSTDVLRVLRGGSWVDYDSDILRAGVRSWVSPVNWNYYGGFRCARS